MKKFSFLLLTLVLLFSSCSKDDGLSPVNDTSGEILGSWNTIDYVYSGNTVLKDEEGSLENPYSAVAKELDYIMTFSSPNIITTEGSMIIELTHVLFGETITQSQPATLIESGTWERNGNELTFITSAQPVTYQIAELTDSKLVLVINLFESISNQGIDVTTTFDVRVTLEKI